MKMNKTSRRNFLQQISFAGIAGTAAVTLPSNAFAKETVHELAAEPDKGHIFLTAPYLQAPTSDSITVMWITNYLCNSWIEFGETEQLGTKVQQSTHGLVNAYNRINAIKLNNLKPDTQYYYKVFSKEFTEFLPYKITYGETISSSIFDFKTPGLADKEVSWLVLNDLHDHPESYSELIKLNGTDPYDFVFLNGDTFSFHDSEKRFIDHLLNPCSFFSSNIPFILGRGNHETRGNFARNVYPYYVNYNHSHYYTFKRGPVFNIVLDTGEDKEDNNPAYAGIGDFDAYRIEQAMWLEAQMQTKEYKKAKFRVVMMHIPHYYCNGWHGSEHANKVFGPLFNKYKIDLMICGHTHKYSVYPPDINTHNFPIIVGGGPLISKRTLIKVKADEAVLKLQIIRDDGQEVGEYTIKSSR